MGSRKAHLCRFCQTKLKRVISLGKIPIVNYFPSKKELKHEKRYPLVLMVCPTCGLCQLSYNIPPRELFKKYHYMSGSSKPLVDHLRKIPEEIPSVWKLPKGSKILDIGANDGTLLYAFKLKGMNVLGVDPSMEAAIQSQKLGIEVKKMFFTKATASKLAKEEGKFDLITFTHTLANILDLHSFFKGVRSLLKSDGKLIFEVGSLEKMLANYQFDAIYHEHYNYFSIPAIRNILGAYGFEIDKIEENDCHGGSTRVYARVGSLPNLVTFKHVSLVELKQYSLFAKKVKIFKTSFKKEIDKITGKWVGYGAPAKSVTLLLYSGIGKKKLSYIIDSTPVKQGRFLPGVHVPIYELEKLKDEEYPYVILLAWNYRTFALKRIEDLRKGKTTLLIPFPVIERLRLGA